MVAQWTTGELKHKKWKHKYHVVKDDFAHVLLYEHAPGIVRRVGSDHLADAILEFLNAMEQDFWVTADEAQKIAKSVLFASPTTALPPTIRMKSEPGLAFHRLPFDVDEHNVFQMPIFEEILSRCSNPSAFAAFIGSIFVPDSDRQQYLWIHGRGRNSKGSMLRLLKTLLGAAFHSDEVELARDKYWTSGFVGKRLVAFPDCNSPCFPKSARFKALTGSDPIRIEGKYDKAYSTMLDCKFLFLSNEELIISSEEADTRRAIYVKMEPLKAIPIRENEYDKMLVDEAKNIISYCIAEYKKMSPKHGEILANNPTEITEIFDDQLLGMLNKKFLFGTGLECKRVDFSTALHDLGVKNPREVARIKRFIFDKMKVTDKHKSGSGEREKVYLGVSTRFTYESLKTEPGSAPGYGNRPK
jgi:hypothetical protein